MGVVKELFDRLLTPEFDLAEDRSIEQAILLEHVQQQDEIAAMLSNTTTDKDAPAPNQNHDWSSTALEIDLGAQKPSRPHLTNF